MTKQFEESLPLFHILFFLNFGYSQSHGQSNGTPMPWYLAGEFFRQSQSRPSRGCKRVVRNEFIHSNRISCCVRCDIPNEETRRGIAATWFAFDEMSMLAGTISTSWQIFRTKQSASPANNIANAFSFSNFVGLIACYGHLSNCKNTSHIRPDRDHKELVIMWLEWLADWRQVHVQRKTKNVICGRTHEKINALIKASYIYCNVINIYLYMFW